MHRIIAAITELNDEMGGPQLDSPGARLAFLVVAGNMSRVLLRPDLRTLAEALPLGPALLLLRAFDEDRSQCASVAAFHVHVVCRVVAAHVRGELALRLRGDVPSRLCRAMALDTFDVPSPRRATDHIPLPVQLRPTVRVPAPTRRTTRRVRAA